MRGKRLLRIATIAVTIGTVAGCGGAAVVGPETVPVSWSPPTTTTPDPTTSARYCQRLDDGRWVTNDSAYSTTPCVPDPSNATGDEQADGSQAIPRCFTCKLSEWDRAEWRKARQAPPGPSDGTTSADTAYPNGWSPQAQAQVFASCTSGWGDNRAQCCCVVDSVVQVQQIPADDAPSLSSYDPEIQAAASDCDSAGEEP